MAASAAFCAITPPAARAQDDRAIRPMPVRCTTSAPAPRLGLAGRASATRPSTNPISLLISSNANGASSPAVFNRASRATREGASHRLRRAGGDPVRRMRRQRRGRHVRAQRGPRPRALADERARQARPATTSPTSRRARIGGVASSLSSLGSVPAGLPEREAASQAPAGRRTTHGVRRKRNDRRGERAAGSRRHVAGRPKGFVLSACSAEFRAHSLLVSSTRPATSPRTRLTRTATR